MYGRREKIMMVCLAICIMMVIGTPFFADTKGQIGGIAHAQPTAPLLRIETGMHTTKINRIATDAENRYLVTSSHDKTARVWELATGRLLRVLRPPIGDGDEGKLYAVALPPDGHTVACGGWTGWDWEKSCYIYLFDRATGQLVRRLTGLPNVILHLAYSPDGRFLAAVLGKQGLRLYRTSDYTLIGEDRDYGDRSDGVAFDRSGRLATTCCDGYVRLYENGPAGELRRVAKVKARGGTQPFSVAFSPDGSMLAVGFDAKVVVDVFSVGSRGLEYEFSPDVSGVENGNLSSVTWSADGQFLYAGGKWGKWDGSRWPSPIRRWSNEGRGASTDLVSGAYSTIMGIVPLKDGSIAFGSCDPAFGLLDTEGRQVVLKTPEISDYSGNREGFLVSSDGATVQFGYEYPGRRPARFTLGPPAP